MPLVSYYCARPARVWVSATSVCGAVRATGTSPSGVPSRASQPPAEPAAGVAGIEAASIAEWAGYWFKRPNSPGTARRPLPSDR